MRCELGAKPEGNRIPTPLAIADWQEVYFVHGYLPLSDLME